MRNVIKVKKQWDFESNILQLRAALSICQLYYMKGIPRTNVGDWVGDYEEFAHLLEKCLRYKGIPYKEVYAYKTAFKERRIQINLEV